MFKAVDEVNTFLADLSIPEEFGYNVDEEDTYFIEEWEDDNRVEGVSFNHGCTKAVISNEKWDCVIKIGFNGSFRCEYEDDDENCENPIYYFTPYVNSTAADHSNYADMEYDAYCNLCDAGLEIIMPHTEPHGMVNGHNIYLQEKAKSVNEYGTIRVPSKGSLDYINKVTDFLCDKQWSANVIDVYGMDFYNRLCDYFNEYPIFKKDMHGGNYGYALDGRPVILDVGGFDEYEYD